MPSPRTSAAAASTATPSSNQGLATHSTRPPCEERQLRGQRRAAECRELARRRTLHGGFPLAAEAGNQLPKMRITFGVFAVLLAAV
mmetsp:Transcript_148074/g.369169  ORF Transcript_148074/g.369169 Transcript_148074/m.369169 type:complete len:86 (+) Transcript_148074:1441-1698(+)